ncbi:alpha/beta hydrolase [Novosphingobium rhizosphaerae]|uniref:alpha/beta hydrolase n=1 Tax=Novosphingobium rhizosphaerae TaxID=1551649 RepID=UPI003D81375E
MRTALKLLLAPMIVLSCTHAKAADPLASYHVRSELEHIPATDIDTYRLWPVAGKDDPGTPIITVLRPHAGRANGTAVIVAPGGAYISLAGMLEGVEPAAWFTARGVTAFILTYRVGRTARLPIPLADGARAVRFVRANAAAFGIDPARIGMMGFSAGGHLAATTAVDATSGDPTSADPIERASSRPDFLILAYPWLEATQIRADGTSQYCEFALHFSSDQCQPQNYAGFLPREHVTKAAPPTFIYHTTDDDLVPVAGSVRFYQALIENGVPQNFMPIKRVPTAAAWEGYHLRLKLGPNF